ncbi:MAG: sodium:solute symporter family protein [Firmicutes bacterium]|nr:sodium:solute symporter family protein [Bacillota bacterium]
MTIQIVIILVYLLTTILIGLLAKRSSNSSVAFHGAGLGVLMCVAAGTGEWLGGTSTTGVSEYGYIFGLSGAWYTIANGIGVIVLALCFAKLYRSLETVTVPGIVEKYLGVDARVVSSILLTLVMVVVGTAQIIAAGTLGVTLLNIDFTLAVLILGTGFIIYTLAGGMIAVGYTNILHLVMMYGGAILAVFFALGDIGWIRGLRVSLPDSYFNFMTIGAPKVSSWVIASILGACTAQAGIQPILAARDVHVAKKAALLTALAVAPFGILTALLGMAARVKFPDLTNPKLALPTLMMDLSPVLSGIVLASILAAILSTVSPIILACGTMLTKDIYQRKLKTQADDRRILRVSRVITGLSGVLCMALAILMYGNTRVLDIVYFAYTIRGSLFIALLFGIYWKKASGKGAIWAMIAATFTGLLWVVYKSVYGEYPLHPLLTETYASVIVAALSMIVFSLFFSNSKNSASNKCNISG